ncbi:thiol-activated cytolysin family protein [Capnocytophaga canimorsus]|uniref:thiol-activated cytolysin family protein n=1 Tax=Capnocytophaga canimorsus TaxID=28188 RepID=UPI0038584853
MKKSKNVLVVLCMALAFTACQKEDEQTFEKILARLKAVEFPDKGDEVLEIKEIPNRDGIKMKVVRKSILIDPIEIVDISNSDVIYPGCVLRGDSFMEGGLDPVAIIAPKDINISISLRGKGLAVKRTSLPSVSDIRQQMNDLITDEQIDHNTAPTHLTYYANEVQSFESFNGVFRAHARASALFGLIKGGFNYETSEFSYNNSKYVLIKVRQFFFNIAVDPKPYDQWGDMSKTNLGEYEPVYVSSVDYGRVAHLLIKTNESAEETHNKISGSIQAGIPIIASASGSVSDNEYYAQKFKSGEIQVMTLGGPLKHGSNIYDMNTFLKFLLVPNAEELIKSAVPIGYKIRTLRDNKEVQVRTYYIEKTSGIE